MVMTKRRHCFLSSWVGVGSGEKGTCVREDRLLDVSFMGTGTPGDWEEQSSLSFWLSPEGCREGAGMWTRTPLNWTAVLNRRNHIPCPVVQDRVSFALSQRGEALPCHCSAWECFMQEEKRWLRILTVVFLLHRGDAVSTGLAFLPLYDCPPTVVRPSLYDSSSKTG